jgi:hypothetical protein
MQLVITLSLLSPGFDSRPIHVDFEVKVALGQVFILVLWFSIVGFVLLTLHIPIIYH